MTSDDLHLRSLKPRNLCIFLDFDGTLVELAATPDGIHVPSGLHGLLTRLHHRVEGRLFIVSGREVSTLKRFLPLYRGDMFGAHGAESWRDGRLERHRLVGSHVVTQVQDAARQAVGSIEGLTLETKDTGAVFHYRGAPQAEDAAHEAAGRIADAADGMALHASKMAFEIRPSDVSKADAVTQVMASQPGHIRPVVVGDDTTDEEAMAVANDRGGVSVRVGAGNTCAMHRLPDPAAVIAVLAHWAQDKEGAV